MVQFPFMKQSAALPQVPTVTALVLALTAWDAKTVNRTSAPITWVQDALETPQVLRACREAGTTKIPHQQQVISNDS